ncbi:signal recognition particle-docking protein FtsY [Candidatus Nitrosocosmicus franklandus]|uniref:Signal recognition particle receptor FtsY n=1 Tax=Candidatus Nitrosocosmicus franklandianus TaxID=1798806 RepID=A0A484I8I2_9ARCH|nr:signal recognition particle-docking protein FtsY [Candidatus Nitrosocosmicus franklandus]VFJ13043.1 Signal recognition particle receptor FtsY [Candidatus Nitrosocosmicus franklandus]
MFEKLKKAFSNAAKSISQKELSDKDLDNALFDLNVSLLESDISQDVIDVLTKQLKQKLIGIKLQKNESVEEVVMNTLKEEFANILNQAGSIDLIQKIQAKKQIKGGPFKLVFLGINGTGKTTTVAKVANLLKKSGFSVVIAAADTHRAGAIEQVSAHAEKLSIKVISQRYGADPSAVARDAVEYARKHYIDVVLIDTAGRMQTAKNLMDEIGKIVKVIKPDMKLFVGDSLAGNDTINQAKEFFTYTEFDGAILTKVDADAKGGSVISISFITSKPIMYLGVGQNYDDIIKFNKEKFVESIFSNESLFLSQNRVQNSISIPAEESHLSAQNVQFSKDESFDKSNENLSLEFTNPDEDIIIESSMDLTKSDTENKDQKEKVVTHISSDSVVDTPNIVDKGIHNDAKSLQKETLAYDRKEDKEILSSSENKKEEGKKKGRFSWFKKKK